MTPTFKTSTAHVAPLHLRGFAPLAPSKIPQHKSPKKKLNRKEQRALDAARSIAVTNLAKIPMLKPTDAKLIEAYMQTGNKAQAYRITFPDKAERWKDRSIISAATAHFARPHMAEAIKAITLAGLFGKPTTLEDHIGEMRNLKERALMIGEVGTARLCEKNIGEVSRLYVNEVVITRSKPRTPAEMVKELAPGNAKGQAGILEAIRAARAKEVALDVVEITGEEVASD